MVEYRVDKKDNIHTTFLENKISELVYEISCALENMDTDYINNLENDIKILSDKFSDKININNLIEFFNEAKNEILQWEEFDNIKNDMKTSYINFGMDEDTAGEEADNFSWQALQLKKLK